MSKPYSQYTKDELMSMLESLTPGGSEFHHEPETCVRFVKDRQRTAITATLKRREAEERCNELSELVKKLDAARVTASEKQ